MRSTLSIVMLLCLGCGARRSAEEAPVSAVSSGDEAPARALPHVSDAPLGGEVGGVPVDELELVFEGNTEDEWTLRLRGGRFTLRFALPALDAARASIVEATVSDDESSFTDAGGEDYSRETTIHLTLLLDGPLPRCAAYRDEGEAMFAPVGRITGRLEIRLVSVHASLSRLEGAFAAPVYCHVDD